MHVVANHVHALTPVARKRRIVGKLALGLDLLAVGARLALGLGGSDHIEETRGACFFQLPKGPKGKIGNLTRPHFAGRLKSRDEGACWLGTQELLRGLRKRGDGVFGGP